MTPQNPRLTSMKQPAFSPPALRRVAQKSNDCGLRSLRHSPIPDSPYKVWQYRLYWKTLFIMYRGQKPRTLSGYCQPRHGRVRDKSDCPFRASDGGSPHCARKRNCNPNKKPLQVFCGVFLLPIRRVSRYFRRRFCGVKTVPNPASFQNICPKSFRTRIRGSNSPQCL